MTGKLAADRERIQKNGQSAEELIRLETDRCQRKVYGNNLKVGGLRLGQSVIFVSRNGAQYFIGLISTNSQINANLEEMIIYHYSIKTADGKTTYSSEQQRYLFLNSVSHFLSEGSTHFAFPRLDDLIGDRKKDFNKTIIFDLIKLPIRDQKRSHELIAEDQDIFN